MVIFQAYITDKEGYASKPGMLFYCLDPRTCSCVYKLALA